MAKTHQHGRIAALERRIGQGWVQRGADIAVTFANVDIFGARATPNGQVWRSYYFQGATRLVMRVQVSGE